MAHYEPLDAQDLMSAASYDKSRSVAAPALASTTTQLAAAVRITLLAFLLVCWSVGAYAGIAYWAVQGSLLGVIGSALIPGIAATSTLSAFTSLER